MGVRTLSWRCRYMARSHVAAPTNLRHRYKFAGTTVVDKDRTRDTAEFFNINKTDFVSPDGAKPEQDWPCTVLESKPLLRDYFNTSHSISMLIMEVLANKLGIDPNEITSRHRIQEKSGDHIRLIRGPPRKVLELPEIQTPMHTDLATYGSVPRKPILVTGGS
jgi:isopenicillin N synthase-like dioxygenase